MDREDQKKCSELDMADNTEKRIIRNLHPRPEIEELPFLSIDVKWGYLWENVFGFEIGKDTKTYEIRRHPDQEKNPIWYVPRFAPEEV